MMTTDIERQFFDKFGIEPKYRDYRTKNGKIYDNKNPKNRNIRLCYPQISDRILLELICILNENTTLDETYYQGASTVKGLKKLVLKDLIKTKDNFDTIHQVQALFEEG